MTHQEEDLGILLPQPEAGEDVVEPVHKEHHIGRSRRPLSLPATCAVSPKVRAGPALRWRFCSRSNLCGLGFMH